MRTFRSGWIDTHMILHPMTAIENIPTRTPRCIGSPGAIALAAAGVSGLELAEALGVDRTSVSLYLSGRVRLPETFGDALEALIGAKGAAAVLAQIPTHVDRRRTRKPKTT